MSSAKGGSFVLDLAARLPDITFLLVGAAEDVNRLPPNVTSFGDISDKAYLANLYDQSNLTLVVSKSESFSMVCAESLACGTPVAGFKGGGPEEVAPQGYGYFVEYGDRDALELGIKRIRSGEEALQSSIACNAYAKQKYGLKIMTERFLHSYEEAISHYE
jgi:glycosyltransferase involved in cell wall biosynthesis